MVKQLSTSHNHQIGRRRRRERRRRLTCHRCPLRSRPTAGLGLILLKHIVTDRVVAVIDVLGIRIAVLVLIIDVVAVREHLPSSNSHNGKLVTLL